MTKIELRIEKLERKTEIVFHISEATEILMAYYLILRENSENENQRMETEARAEAKIRYIDELKTQVKKLQLVKTEKQLKKFDTDFDEFYYSHNPLDT